MRYPKVLSERETLALAATRSIARFGDGELRLALGKAAVSQEPDPKLARELGTILAKPGPCVVCIPNWAATPRKENWMAYAAPKFTRLYRAGPYGSAFISRPDSAPWIDRPEYWEAVRDLWRGRDITLVAGDRKSLTPETLADARGIRVIEGPPKHAYSVVDRLESEIGKPAGTVMLCLGAAATVLAWRLARKGVHALDLGHIGMFMRAAGAYRHGADDLTSPGYRKQLQAKHREVKWGNSGKSHAPEVTEFAERIGANSILDYGCGRGTLAEAMAPRRVFEYDPGIKGKDALPKPADLVVATDVLEHIEPKRLGAVLDHICRLALKGAYLVISLRPAREILPDGRNAHLIVEGEEWWLDRLRQLPWRIDRHEMRRGLCVWLTK